MCVSQQFQHVLNMLAGYNPVWRGGEISVIMTLPGPRREVEKSWLTLLLNRGLMWSVTEPTQETHWKTCLCSFHCSRNGLVFQKQTEADVPRCVQIVREHGSIVSQSVSTSPPRRTSALFLAHSTSSTLAKMSWPRMRNQGTYHLQKICILLCPGEKMILCPQNFKMLYWATNWDGRLWWELCIVCWGGRVCWCIAARDVESTSTFSNW